MVDPLAHFVVRPVDWDEAGRLSAHSHPLFYPRLNNKLPEGGAVAGSMLTPPGPSYDWHSSYDWDNRSHDCPGSLLLTPPPIFPHIKPAS